MVPVNFALLQVRQLLLSGDKVLSKWRLLRCRVDLPRGKDSMGGMCTVLHLPYMLTYAEYCCKSYCRGEFCIPNY